MNAKASPRRMPRQRLEAYLQRARNPRPLVVEGKLKRMVGLTLESVGCQAAIGDQCRVIRPGGVPVEAEVVGFSGDKLLLMPIGDVRGLAPNARVIPVGRGGQIKVGDGLLGRVLDGTGVPLDGKGPLDTSEHFPMSGHNINPMARRPVHQPLDVGVRAINALFSVGEGQRMGLFAGSGVGKSILLGMMTRFTSADIVVVGLIGERGREVKEFITDILGDEGMARAVVVAAPADEPPLVRLHGAMLATSIAEYFRDRGFRVLLLMDSLTRFAQAQREIALAIGEPPATRGYPPSVFARLPQLVERAGNGGEEGGSITAFYTILTESDDQGDPLAEAARAILDGHIVLSRRLAEQGCYPAIDVESSISRVMPNIAESQHQQQARHFRQLYSTYQDNYDLINVGAYTAGSNEQLDEAIRMYPSLLGFVRQEMNQPVSFNESLTGLEQLLANATGAAGVGV